MDRAEDLPFFLRQVFREATSGAPAPVHLELPGMFLDVLLEDIDYCFKTRVLWPFTNLAPYWRALNLILTYAYLPCYPALETVSSEVEDVGTLCEGNC